MSGNAYHPAALTVLPARAGANARPALMQLGLDFLSSSASLALDFLDFGPARAALRTQFLPVGLSFALAFTAAAAGAAAPSLTANFAAGVHVPNRNPSLTADFLAPVQPGTPTLQIDLLAQSYQEGLPDPGIYAAGTPAADEGTYAAGIPDALPPGVYLTGSSQGQYQAGYRAPGIYQAGAPVSGLYTIGDYDLQIAVELSLNFLASQEKNDPLAYEGMNLILDFTGSGPYTTQPQYIARGTLNFASVSLSFLAQSYGVGSPQSPPDGTRISGDPPFAIGFVTPSTKRETRLGRAVLGDVIL